MAQIQIKRIYEPAEPEDGERILVDRLWPRGVSKARAALDLWDKDAAPSTELRKWFGHEPERFAAFSARYDDELNASQGAKDLAALCKKTLAEGKNVTLLYAAHDPACNHALVLKAWLDRDLGLASAPAPTAAA